MSQRPVFAEVVPDLLLDARLALFHRTEKWLAVADVHFGYELSHRAAGNLFPDWGMQSVTSRLEELLTDHQPERLIIVGDLVHDRASRAQASDLLARVEAQFCPVHFLAGNHDRKVFPAQSAPAEFRAGSFLFHHGDCQPAVAEGMTQIIGHHHPAAVVRDGAGLRLKIPAFVQTAGCWILPAFSPWAAGAEWKPDESTRVWACSPRRIFELRD